MDNDAPTMTPDEGVEECKNHIDNPGMTQFNDKFIAEE
jgi:hypothetical protein